MEDDASCIMEDGNDQSIISNQKLPNTGSMEDIDVSAQTADAIALSNKEIAVTSKGGSLYLLRGECRRCCLSCGNSTKYCVLLYSSDL